FVLLMKTGWPEYYIPSPSTVSRDVKLVFVNIRKCIVRMLQTYNWELNFATDAWTSLNHKVFIAMLVHFEYNGEPLAILLDIVEVAKVSITSVTWCISITLHTSHTQACILQKPSQRF
ncbi:hypothetical protein CY34DRAFT_87177, partial [Suillus luteus UH-Slu-Lm8-n1]